MKRIGVMTSGGDAPGMNAAIRAVVRTAINNGLDVKGFNRGYEGLIDGDSCPLKVRSVSGIINKGGTILKTVRSLRIKTQQGVKKACATLKKNKIDGLVVIGGDGTFRGAVKLYEECGIPVAGIPASIDNDIAGTDVTIGFDTAVNTAVQAIDKIRDTATSHERLFIIEVMGRERGFLALAVGLASGAEIILVPEIKPDFKKIDKILDKGYKQGKTSSIIVMAEGAGNPYDIARIIKANVTEYEIRISVIGYIQRGGAPTAYSRLLACRFGFAAVLSLLGGNPCSMVGMRNNRLVISDMRKTSKKEKRVTMELYKLNEILAI